MPEACLDIAAPRRLPFGLKSADGLEELVDGAGRLDRNALELGLFKERPGSACVADSEQRTAEFGPGPGVAGLESQGALQRKDGARVFAGAVGSDTQRRIEDGVPGAVGFLGREHRKGTRRVPAFGHFDGLPHDRIGGRALRLRECWHATRTEKQKGDQR